MKSITILLAGLLAAAWPASWLAQHFVWGAVRGRVERNGVVLNIERHYDFPDSEPSLDEDQSDTLKLSAGEDASGAIALIGNLGRGQKVYFVLQP